MSGAGNLFSVADLRAVPELSTLSPSEVAQLCIPNEWANKGTEGLLIVGNAQGLDRDFDVSFYNPDGSSSMMCGNGARCALRFAVQKGIVSSTQKTHRFLMAGRVYQGVDHGDRIEILFEAPTQIEADLEETLEGATFHFDMINLGSDHIVVSEEEFSSLMQKVGTQSDAELASVLRHHHRFPRGTNVNIVRVKSMSDDVQRAYLDLRTFERGVEDFTGACGTGALATAVSVSIAHGRKTRSFMISPPSKEQLEVQLDYTTNENIHLMHLIGPATVLGQLNVVVTKGH